MLAYYYYYLLYTWDMGLETEAEMFILKTTVEEMTSSHNMLIESVTHLLRSSYYITTIFYVGREGENNLILGGMNKTAKIVPDFSHNLRV